MRFLAILFSVLAPLAAAIEITHPDEGTKIVAGDAFKVTWTFVDTDPKKLSLYLVNFVEYPPTYVPLAIDIKTHKAYYNVHIPCDTHPGPGYQINAIEGTNVYVIYAQSEHFKIRDNHKKDECFHDDDSDNDHSKVDTPAATMTPVARRI